MDAPASRGRGAGMSKPELRADGYGAGGPGEGRATIECAGRRGVGARPVNSTRFLTNGPGISTSCDTQHPGRAGGSGSCSDAPDVDHKTAAGSAVKPSRK